MKSPTAHRKQTASFTLVNLLAIAPLWLMLATANTSAHAQTSNPSPGDWTEFLRDNMQRWNPYETILGVNNVGGLHLLWKRPTFDQFLFSLDPSPAVVNGKVYVGDDNGNVYALNASTGAQLWSYATGSYVGSSLAVVNGVVYFGANDGNVYALDASTGAKLWTYAADPNGLHGGVQSSATVVNGVVYIGSADRNLYALNAATGAKLWTSPAGDTVSTAPAVVNGVVYFADDNNDIYALNASTGAGLWSYGPGNLSGLSPAVANGVVYVTDCGNFYALNASTGAKLWTHTSEDGFCFSTSPAVANGVVYVGSNGGNFYALNASTGAKLWSYATGGDVRAAPAVANGVVYFGSDTEEQPGAVFALNASTGAKLWSYVGTGSSDFVSPVIVNGVLYMRGLDPRIGKNLYAFGLAPEADLLLRIEPTPATVHQGDLLTFAFPVWNLGPGDAVHEVLNTQVPAGTVFDYIRISGTPALGTCTTPQYQGTGQIVCNENAAMAPNTTWTVRLTVKVTAPAGTVITENAATMSDSLDPNMANNTATVSISVQ